MMRPGFGRFALIAATLVAAQAVASGSAHAGTLLAVRYASPTGSGVACSLAQPCRIGTAINNAPTGSEVILEPGSYGSAGHPLKTTIGTLNAGPDLYVHGQTGARPVIYMSTAQVGLELSDGSRLSNVELFSSNPDSTFIISGSVDHIISIASNGFDGACSVYAVNSSVPGSLTDSLCIQTAASDPAIGIVSGGNNASSIRGVTAIATGANGVGLSVEEDATSPSANDVTATNSIFKGVGVDVRTVTPSTGPASITVSHCDYALTGISNHGTLHADATDIHTPPIFVNAPTDYREAAGSPTINAGAADTGSDTDLAGLPRVLGSAPDIGAFERAQPPATHGLKVTRTTKHSAHLTVKANPEGLATTVKILASHHHHSTTRSVGTGRTAKKVKLTVKGLKRHTKYQFHAVATNAAGHAHSAKVKAKTR